MMKMMEMEFFQVFEGYETGFWCRRKREIKRDSWGSGSMENYLKVVSEGMLARFRQSRLCFLMSGASLSS